MRPIGRARFTLAVTLVVMTTVFGWKSHGQTAQPAIRDAASGAIYNRALTAPEKDLWQKTLPNPYQLVEDWAKMPEGRKWGAPSQVDIDPDGKSLWVAERCGQDSCVGSNLPPILKFDASGTLVTSFGAGMFNFPHGLHVDRDGNVWVTDGEGEGGKGHQVFKFSPDGKVLLTLGKAGVAGNGPDTFNQPTDVVVAQNGDIFVADGHTPVKTPRIVHFSKDGKFINAWGSFGPAVGQLQDPHCLEIAADGRLFVCDRRNDRIQIFDQQGKSIGIWTQFGRPSGMFLSKDGKIYVANQELGIVIGNAKDGSISDFVKVRVHPTARTRAAESVVADATATNLYAGEIGAFRLMKYVRK